MIRFSCLCILCVLLSHADAANQPEDKQGVMWRTTNITNEDGLSNSAINSIFRDSRGFMWFGSWDGLNRFDGTTIKRYYPNLYDQNAISNNIIRNIIEDSNENLWIVTERGLNRYSHHLETFSSWFNDFPELSLRENSLKAHMGFDGQIWVNLQGRGFYRFSPPDDDFILVALPGINASDLLSLDNFFFDQNLLILLMNDQLIVYDLEANIIRDDFFLPLPGNEYANLSVAESWFCSFNQTLYLLQSLHDGGLLVTDIHQKHTRELRRGDKSFHVTASGKSYNKEFLWLGTDDGNILKLYPTQNFSIESVSSRLPALADSKVKIWSVCETSDNLLWIGTDGEGVFRINLNSKPFFSIQKGEPHLRQLNHQIVRAIHEDDSGNLWVGTRGNGLNFLPYKTGDTRHFTIANGLTNNAVLSVEEDLAGNLWIGHDGTGIDILRLQSGKFYHFPEDLKGAEHLSFGSVYDICVDAFGQVWLGTSGYGVVGLEIQFRNGQYHLMNHTHIMSNNNHDALGSNIVYAIVEERPNILWLGTRGAGIYRFNTLTDSLENYSMAKLEKPGLNDKDILSLFMASDGNLWVGSSGGLNKININYRPYSFKNFTTTHGLPNNTIHAILEDDNKNIWVSTNKGLSQFNIQDNTFTNFNSADGLQNNEYTDGAAARGEKSGAFYFGGINGLDWFFPQQIVTSIRQPIFLFTGLRLYNQMIYPGDSTNILDKNINELEEIVLKHNQNFFSIEFTTLNFINPNKSHFEYKLENFHTEWIAAGNQREANFTNVPYGRYRLLVRATNEDGLWSDEVNQLAITIKPPFWKTWQAMIVYVILSILALMLISRIQANRIKQKEQRALEKLQQEKEKELTQYKLEFFTNLAHEFGTPLTLIFASAASLLNPKRGTEETSNLVKTIYQNSRRMQKLVQELLEFRKVETRREKILPSKIELITTINNIVDVFSHFVRESELEISFEPDENELWVVTDASKLEKIMINLLSNAIKYTPAGGGITVVIRKANHRILISISDTGIGISDQALPYIFDSFYQQSSMESKKPGTFKGIGIGLAYTKSLVELLDGTISVESRLDYGSAFTVDLPLTETQSSPINGSLPEVSRKGVLIDNIHEELIPLNKNYFASNNQARALWTTPKKYRVLIAEDDQELSDMLMKLLSEQYEVNVTPNGKKAYEFITGHRVDIVVSDILMPEMDGLTLCKKIKADILTSHIPVILLTARTEIESRIEGLEMGADSYIPKPFHPRHLFVRIEKLLKSREQVSEHFKANFGTPAYTLQKDFSTRDKELMEKCIEFINLHYADENIDADQLASHLAMSKAQLYRKIKALTGLTPHGLIKNFRLKMARQLIAQGDHPISDIVFLTGFNNRTYFYRSYKEAFGETPGEINKNTL